MLVAELAVGLGDDRTLGGVLVFAGLFSSVWWAWAGFTFYANRFDTDDVVYRLAKLGAMLGVAGLAASASDATGTLAGQFAFCQAAIRMVLVALYVRAYRHVVQARGLIVVYLTAGAIAAGLWLAGALVSGPARYAAWVVAVAVEVIAPVVATRRSAGLPLHLEYLPERLGVDTEHPAPIPSTAVPKAATRDQPVNLSGSRLGTHQHYSPAGANCCQSLLLDPDATISIDLHKRLFLLVSGRGE